MTTVPTQTNQLPIRDDGIPLLRDFVNFKREPLDFWIETGQIAPVTRTFFGRREYWIVTDADWAQYILQKRARNFPRERRLREADRKEARTVFNVDTYDEWIWRRRLLQPAFHRKQIAAFADGMVRQATRLADEWGDEIALKDEMKTLTMRIIAETMFSADLQDTDIMQHCFEVAAEHTFKQISAIVPIPLWLPTPANRRVRSALDQRHEILGNIVQQRYASGEPQGDLLDMLIAGKLDSGEQFTAEHLLQEMVSIVFAGHETTALTLTWLFYLLSQMPDVEARLREEVDAVLGGRPITLRDMGNMPYTEQVIKEVLRLYPPVYLTLREADEDDEFDGIPIPAQTRFVINIRGLHHSERYWDRPDQFDPTRFADKPTHHKFAYIPFLAGPKKCIGDTFAMMEMRLVIPTILQRTRLTFAGDTHPEPIAGFVMEADQPIGMAVHK